MPKQGFLSKASPARLMALEVGTSVRTRKAFTQEIIARTIDVSSLSSQDRAFATRLSLGVTSSCGTLDEVIDSFLRSPDDIKPDVRDALRLSTYELLFLDKSSHVAVSQGVELVKSITPKAAGLANFVLRKIADTKADFPFGNPANDIKALARKYAFPVWMTEMLIADLGLQAAEDFMEASNEPAPVFLAVNALKAEDAWLEAFLAQAGINVEPFSFPELSLGGCLRLKEAKFLQNSHLKTLFATGKLLVSDAASQAVATIATPQKNIGTYLEIGSGRGTKTILLQSNAKRSFGSQFPLFILDKHASKNERTLQRAALYGAKVEKAFTHDATKLTSVFPEKSFDTIFIDAPCSGLGTLRRHPEIRWRIKPREIRSLALLGALMLNQAARFVAKNGRLIYATCTVTKTENLDVIRGFLRSKQGRDFEIDPLTHHEFFSPVLSPGSSDAHFAVRLVRKS